MTPRVTAFDRTNSYIFPVCTSVLVWPSVFPSPVLLISYLSSPRKSITKYNRFESSIYMQSLNPLSVTTLVMWEVLRRTYVKMKLRLISITNWWCFVREDWINQIMPCISRHCCLCKQFCQVKLSWNLPNPENTCSLIISNPIVTDDSCLLFKADMGILKSLTTDMLSKNTSAGPSTDTPKNINLYRRA